MDGLKNMVKERLELHGIKPSMQRMAVMEYLMTHRTHPTAEMIFADLYPHMPTLSKATVYNTLNLLVERGVVRLITIEEKNARFDACMDPHIHFRCRDCGAILDVDVEAHWVPAMPEGVTVEMSETYCIGSCAECNSQKVN
ncbi:MAG: transcriptional repressor [Bacteroidaceae bacterium]|nr:transcriptional repressor [Bacteroidaceae bacterium]